MEQFKFTPENGFLDTTAFPDPSGENDTREQLFELHKQTRDYINDNLAGKVVQSDTVVAVKGNQVGFSYSTDGETFIVVGGGGGGGDGDMHTSVYDSNADGIVNGADTVNGHTVLSDVPADAVFTDTWASDKSTVEGRIGHLDNTWILIEDEVDPNGGTVYIPFAIKQLLFVVLFHGQSSSYVFLKQMDVYDLIPVEHVNVPTMPPIILANYFYSENNRMSVRATFSTQNRVFTFARTQNGYVVDYVYVWGR